MAILAIVCTCCFLIRAIFTLIQLKYPFIDIVWFDALYYFCLEIIPLFLMLIVLSYTSKKNNDTDDESSSGLTPTAPLIT